VNESTVGVGGDSAGGRLAAMICHDLPEISYQVMVLSDGFFFYFRCC
jgi:acetyl esterase/lipase